LSSPETWLTDCSYDIGNTFGPKGLSRRCKFQEDIGPTAFV
jgi:hypothetical protein